MIIINSDDFGYSQRINKATFDAFQQGLISSTTTLVNFEDGFRDAVSYVHNQKINPKAIGIHLNLSEGTPLTLKMRKNQVFCELGIFKGKKAIPEFKLDSKSMEDVYHELEAQLNYFIEVMGFIPSHIDSHHHTHTKLPILRSVIKLAKKNGIKSIRISRNIKTGGDLKKRIYKIFINQYLRIIGFKVVDKFGDISELIEKGTYNSTKRFEVMVHVNLSEDGEKIIDIDENELEPKIIKLFRGKKVRLSNYSTL